MRPRCGSTAGSEAPSEAPSSGAVFRRPASPAAAGAERGWDGGRCSLMPRASHAALGARAAASPLNASYIRAVRPCCASLDGRSSDSGGCPFPYPSCWWCPPQPVAPPADVPRVSALPSLSLLHRGPHPLSTPASIAPIVVTVSGCLQQTRALQVRAQTADSAGWLARLPRSWPSGLPAAGMLCLHELLQLRVCGREGAQGWGEGHSQCTCIMACCMCLHNFWCWHNLAPLHTSFCRNRQQLCCRAA